MSTGTSSTPAEALKEADAKNNRKGTVIRVSPIITKDETRTIINGACTIRPILLVQDGRSNETIIEEEPSQGNNKPPRRPLSGTTTGLLMLSAPNRLNQSSVPRLASPTILRPVGSRFPSSVFEGRNEMIENCPIPMKLVPLRVAEKPSTNRMEIDDDAKQNVCTGCRALIKPVCGHCGTPVESGLKRLKSETVNSPLVTLTRLHSTGINTTVKKTAPKRYLRLEITRVDEKCNQPPVKRMTVRHTNREPPECLTLSDDGTEKSSVGKTGFNRPSENVGSDEKLPEMTNSSVPTAKETETTEVTNTDFEPVPPFKHSIACRSVRIGSYKTKNIAVHMTEERFSLEIPTVADKVMVKINLTFKDMTQILVHFGNNLPLLAIKTTKSYSSTIRNRLQMSSIKGPYYDPDSSDELQQCIIFVLDKLPEEVQVSIKKWFKERKVSHHNISHHIFEEITYSEASHILLKSVPPEIRDQVFKLSKSTRVGIVTKVAPVKTKEMKSEASSKT